MVVFLETLVTLVEKSPVAGTYSEAEAKDLAVHIRGMAKAVTAEALNPAVLGHSPFRLRVIAIRDYFCNG